MPQLGALLSPRGECNRAVVVSVARFYPGVSLGKRPGADKDSKNLHKTLSKLGFKVDIHSDLSSGEISELFLSESQRPVESCFLAVLSTHGEEGCVFGADGRPVQLSRIFSFFDNKHMEAKTKLFLIQACRGHALDEGVEVDSAVDDSAAVNLPQHLSIAIDTAVMYATAPGYGAFINPLGSAFLQSFCSILNEEGNRNLELTRLLTRLSHRVAFTFKARGGDLAGKKEMPCFVTRLTRDAFPFAEPGKVGVAEGNRARTPSIS